MLILNKILPVFFLPLGLAFVLLLIALLTHKRWPAVLAVVGLYFSSIPLVGDWLIGAWERRYPAQSVQHVAPADAIVVLGGIFGPAVVPGQIANVGEAAERLDAGVQLWQAQRAPFLIFTGGRLPWSSDVKLEGEQSKAQAELRGVAADRILVTREVANTADEAQAIAALMRERGWQRIILVTTGWHMPRAVRLFSKAGVNADIFPVDFRCDPAQKIGVLSFVPTAGALGNTETVLRELYGYAFYAVTGR